MIIKITLLPILAFLRLSHGALLAPRDDPYQDLVDRFRGIYWGRAKTSCSPAELAILGESTRMAIEMTAFSTLDPLWYESAAWNRFFVTSGDWLSGPGEPTFTEIATALKQLETFPLLGRKNKPAKEIHQVAYYCGDVPFTEKCKGGVTAYTVKPGKTEGWAVAFCPKFFSLRYLNDITNGPEKHIADLRTLDLVSYEHVVVHEWMHCKIMGTVAQIEDVKAIFPEADGEVAAYGAERCHEFAWNNTQPDRIVINPKTARNADNYAWFVTNYWFGQKWHWRDRGFILPALGSRLGERDSTKDRRDFQQDLLLDDPKDLVSQTQIPGKPPPGIPAQCKRTIFKDWFCDHIGQS